MLEITIFCGYPPDFCLLYPHFLLKLVLLASGLCALLTSGKVVVLSLSLKHGKIGSHLMDTFNLLLSP